MIVSSFLSYLILFVILVAIAVCGAMLGVKLAKRKNAKNAQQNTVAEEVDQLADLISNNGGHLTEDGKKYLDQLLAVSPDNYWLNLIKTKEK